MGDVRGREESRGMMRRGERNKEGCEDGEEEEGGGEERGRGRRERERRSKNGEEKGKEREWECMNLLLSQPQMSGLLWLKVGEVPSGRRQVS